MKKINTWGLICKSVEKCEKEKPLDLFGKLLIKEKKNWVYSQNWCIKERKKRKAWGFLSKNLEKSVKLWKFLVYDMDQVKLNSPWRCGVPTAR